MDKTAIKEKILELATGVAEDEGVEIVNVEILGSVKKILLRIYIDKEGGVTIGDCERISRRLEALLDVEDFIKTSYVLEVSSPGLDRPLLQKVDFEKNIGKLVRIITSEKIDNQTFFIGRIIDVGDTWVRLKIKSKEEKDLYIPLNKISKAKLEIEF